MEYQRKNRWANYWNPKCKVYLRNDFSHECAYCKIQEKELGLADTKFFEIDHFKPQANEDASSYVHEYNNLYYSCLECNSKKNNIWNETLPDPCNDNIFFGEGHLIEGGYSPEELYKYDSADARGWLYINTFQLNSKYQINVRKRRILRNNSIREIDVLMDDILHKFSTKKNADNLSSLISKIDELRSAKIQELSKLSCDENFEAVRDYLFRRNIKNEVIFEEHNIDIKIKLDEESYYCELLIDNSEEDLAEKIKYLDIEKISVWFEKVPNKFGILFYYSKLDKLYFYPISKLIEKKDVADFKSKKQIKLTAENLIA